MKVPRLRARTSPLFVEDFGDVDVLAAVNADFPALDVQRLVERDGLQIFDRHFLVSAMTWRSLFTLPMASSRMVAMMPPWQWPGGPV